MNKDLNEISNSKFSEKEINEIIIEFEKEFSGFFAREDYDLFKRATSNSLLSILRDLTKLKFTKDGTLTINAFQKLVNEFADSASNFSEAEAGLLLPILEKFIIILIITIDEDDELPDEYKLKIINLMHGSLINYLAIQNISLEYVFPNVQEKATKYIEKYTATIKSENLDSFNSAKKNLEFLKNKIELSGYKLFYFKGGIIRKEDILLYLYSLTWSDTVFDVNQQVNNGRGAADFKISFGASDSTIVEFKLASNPHLRHLERQISIYLKANNTQKSIRVIIFFSSAQEKKVNKVLKELSLIDSPTVVLIDARKYGKKSASTLRSRAKKK